MQGDKLRTVVAEMRGLWMQYGPLTNWADRLEAIAEAAEDLRAEWIQVPRQEFRAMLHYTECYADKFPSSGARETVADYFETLQRDAALSTVAPVREVE